MKLTELVRNALARIVRVREALADSDIEFAARVLEDLEHDLAGAITTLREAA